MAPHGSAWRGRYCTVRAPHVVQAEFPGGALSPADRYLAKNNLVDADLKQEVGRMAVSARSAGGSLLRGTVTDGTSSRCPFLERCVQVFLGLRLAAIRRTSLGTTKCFEGP